MKDYSAEPSTNEGNLLSSILFRYLPYWPLFVFLLLVCATGAWIYLQYATPVYEIAATILLKDESKGADDSRSIGFLNVYTSKKIVENEIEVIHSRSLMNEVVNNLHLYAPVREENHLKSYDAYNSSPVTVELKEPGKIKEVKRINFSYSPDKGVRLAGRFYSLNQWIGTPYGTLRFIENKYKNTESKDSLYFSLIEPRKVVNTLLDNLEVSESSKLSTVINLTLKDEVPERGENILNELTGAYNRSTVNDKNALAANTLAFVEEHMKTVASGLDSIEKLIQQYKSQKGAVDLSEQSKLFLENVSDNDRKVADIDSKLSVLDQVENYVVSKNSGTGIVPATLGVDDPILKQLLQRLSEAELQYENLKQTIPENNSILISLKKEIEQIRPRVLENIHNLQVNLRASKNNMSNSGNTFSSVLQALPSKERKLVEISRQQAVASNLYSFLLQKREEMALSYAATVPDSRVIDKGESSIKPVSPKKWIVCLAALGFSLVLSIVFINGKELLNNKILFRSDIEKFTNIPIAAEIANMDQKSELVTDQPNKAIMAEQFRQLLAAIGMYSRKVTKRKLLITSSISGEGKSFVAVNLAVSLAGSGRKTVLLDIDLRNPKSTSIFKLRDAKGISEYLSGDASINEIILKSGYDNLNVIPAGGVSVNPTELLLNGNLNELFEYLEKKFDYILIDTSPLGPLTDAYVLSEYCDKTLFVVRHGYTPKTIVQLLDENNKIKAMKDVSIVFNGVKKRGFIKGGYGFGYGFGNEYIYKERDLEKNKVNF